MEDHICFTCEYSSKRKTGRFLETRCDFFPAVIPQADRNITGCEKYWNKKGAYLANWMVKTKGAKDPKFWIGNLQLGRSDVRVKMKSLEKTTLEKRIVE